VTEHAEAGSPPGLDCAAFELRIKDKPSAPETPGALLSTGWKWESAGEVSKGGGRGRHFAVALSHSAYPITLKLHTWLDGTPVLARWLEIKNTGALPLALTACYPWAGRLWDKDAEVAWLHSTKWQVPWEGWLGWDRLRPGTNLYKNDHGLVWDDPLFVLRNESSGGYFFGQLAWPVNFEMVFQRQKAVTFKFGPIAVDPLRVLAPGETVTSPTVHLGYAKQDFDAAVQAMHTHIRRSVIPRRDQQRAYRVQCLFPEDQPLTVYRGDDCNEANLKQFFAVCAAAGVELFILDGPTWAEGYGRWRPKPKPFPHGLGPLLAAAHQHGLLFGVYAEVEGGRGHWEATRAWAEHNDWFLARNPDYPWRNFINLARPDAAAYAEAELDGIIESLKLDIYRHDQNGCFGGEGSVTPRDGFNENDYWRYYQAWHAILDRTRAKYPRLILQQASGSGARLELGTLAHWDENYTSDRASYPHVYQMLSGLTVYLPPEVLVTPNGMAGNCKDQPDYLTMLRSVYTLGETPMIFNGMLPRTVAAFKPQELQLLQRYNRLYKNFIRPLLPTLKVWHHAPVHATGGVETGGWFALQFSSPDKTKAWATIIRLANEAPGAYRFQPKGLEPKKTYRVTFDNTGRTERTPGASLMRDGLAVPVPSDPKSELVLFELER